MIMTTGSDTIDVVIDTDTIAVMIVIGIVILTTDIVETDSRTGVIKSKNNGLSHAGATTQVAPA